MTERFLPGVPVAQAEAMINAVPGNEIKSGKFDSPESSAALAANTFGFFLNRPKDLPSLPKIDPDVWPVLSLDLERRVNFPWRGGRHPVLDVFVATPRAIIGVECKRFEPFRTLKDPHISEAFWRPKWGNSMNGYQSVRDALCRNKKLYAHLDAAQLFKHALALRAQVTLKGREHEGLIPILMYIYAEPEIWPRSGQFISEEAKSRHREEIVDFARRIEGDEVRFAACSYRELLQGWENADGLAPDVRDHAKAVAQHFAQ